MRIATFSLVMAITNMAVLKFRLNTTMLLVLSLIGASAFLFLPFFENIILLPVVITAVGSGRAIANHESNATF